MNYKTQNTDIPVYIDGQLTAAYKRKLFIRRTRYVIELSKLVIAFYGAKAFKATLRSLDELSRPVRLDILDHKYGTNLRSQYFSGKRTQQILQAKRAYGL